MTDATWTLLAAGLVLAVIWLLRRVGRLGPPAPRTGDQAIHGVWGDAGGSSSDCGSDGGGGSCGGD